MCCLQCLNQIRKAGEAIRMEHLLYNGWPAVSIILSLGVPHLGLELCVSLYSAASSIYLNLAINTAVFERRVGSHCLSFRATTTSAASASRSRTAISTRKKTRRLPQ